MTCWMLDIQNAKKVLVIQITQTKRGNQLKLLVSYLSVWVVNFLTTFPCWNWPGGYKKDNFLFSYIIERPRLSFVDDWI